MKKHVKESIEMDNQLYEVDSIIDKRLCDSKVEYKVKWTNYPIEESTWEPLENLTNTKKALKKFERNCKKKKAETTNHVPDKENKKKTKGNPLDEVMIDLCQEKDDECFECNTNKERSSLIEKHKLQTVIVLDCKNEPNEVTENGYRIEPSKIISINKIRQIKDKMYALISFQCTERGFATIKHDSIETKKLSKIAPQLLVDYYESQLQFTNQ